MKDVLVLGLAAFLILRLTSQQRLVAGGAGTIPANNQNSDMWLKQGGMQIARDLLKEWARGSVKEFAVSTVGGAAGLDGWTGTGAFSSDSGGYW